MIFDFLTIRYASIVPLKIYKTISKVKVFLLCLCGERSQAVSGGQLYRWWQSQGHQNESSITHYSTLNWAGGEKVTLVTLMVNYIIFREMRQDLGNMDLLR